MHYSNEIYYREEKEKKKTIIKSIKFEPDFLKRIDEISDELKMNFSDFTKQALRNEINRIKHTEDKTAFFAINCEKRSKIVVLNHLIEKNNFKTEDKERAKKELIELWDM